jgi:murein tripeptide amidase MpaA
VIFQVVEYITYNLLTQYDNDTTVRAIRDSYDFYILPVVNPDGKSETPSP